VRRWLAAVALVCLPACDATTLLVDLQLASGMPQPGALRLSLFHDGVVGRSTVPTGGRDLPGTLLVQNVPAGPGLRILCEGLDGAGKLLEQAAQTVSIAGGKENHLSLTLGALLPDSDGDGVPDVIDDCPGEADPDQKCSATAADLGAHDLAGRDLSAAPVDLAKRGDAGGSVACPADAILCDDFETGDSSKWNGSANQTPQMKASLALTIDGVKAHSGNFALHALAQKSDLSGNWFMTLDANLNALAPPWGLRVYMQLTDALDDYTLGVALYSGNDTLAIGGETADWLVDEDLPANGFDHTTTNAIPLGQWVCVELVHDGTLIHLYTDGSELTSFSPNITTPYDSMSLGLVRWASPADTEMFFDDFVLAKSRVGCP
jgi:hypothetical protein